MNTVFFVIAAALILQTQARRDKWNIQQLNQNVSESDSSSQINKNQWLLQALNRSEFQALNRTQLNKDRWNLQSLNRSQQRETDRNVWNLQALNRSQEQGNNNSRFDKLQFISTKFNKSQSQWGKNPDLINLISRRNITSDDNDNNRTLSKRSVAWNIPARNQSEWNRTQWQIQGLNNVFNRSQQREINRTQWNLQALNRSRDQALKNTEWNLQALNRSRAQALNRTQWNSGLANNSRFNRSEIVLNRWNRTQGLTKRAAVWHNPWNQTTANGDVIIGQIGYLDRLLFNQTYLKESRWWSSREKIIEYPKDLPGKYSYNRHENITAIRIYNKFYDGLESSAKVLSGGVGYRYVKIKLSSPWNRGFHYLVQIFGK